MGLDHEEAEFTYIFRFNPSFSACLLIPFSKNAIFMEASRQKRSSKRCSTESIKFSPTCVYVGDAVVRVKMIQGLDQLVWL
ncbi:hypothetical protein HA466_0009460 [Hirschfeldia incana]|nr:hypothetical protein HA466_0009460 [Hirschfeldia incana]